MDRGLVLDVDGIFSVLVGEEVNFVITADVSVELAGIVTGSEKDIDSDVDRVDILVDVCIVVVNIAVVPLAEIELGTDELLEGFFKVVIRGGFDVVVIDGSSRGDTGLDVDVIIEVIVDVDLNDPVVVDIIFVIVDDNVV